MPSLSVIIPVYNTQKGLRRCLDSILAQESANLEIVIVNDGSTDDCEQIIQEYEQKFPSIAYYKKEHTGVADTRNFGIEKATGDYIFFVDSDDYIDTELLKHLQYFMEQKMDVIKFKLARTNEAGEIIEKVSGAVFDKTDGEEAFKRLYSTDVLLDSPCVYLFRKEYIQSNGFQFKVGTYHEDFGLIPMIIIHAASVVSLDYYAYFYVQSDGSITRNADYAKTIQKMKDSLIQYDTMLEKIKSLSLGKEAEENIKIYYTNAILQKLKELQSKEQKEFIYEVRKRNMIKNIKIRSVKQFVKRIVLTINIRWYLKATIHSFKII